jgi:hypothetical protein
MKILIFCPKHDSPSSSPNIDFQPLNKNRQNAWLKKLKACRIREGRTAPPAKKEESVHIIAHQNTALKFIFWGRPIANKKPPHPEKQKRPASLKTGRFSGSRAVGVSLF